MKQPKRMMYEVCDACNGTGIPCGCKLLRVVVTGLTVGQAEKLVEDNTKLREENYALRSEIKNNAEQIRLTAQAEIIGHLQAGIEGKEGIYPDWVYEARNAIKHQNENIPWLPDLLKILGWQGGTVHQAMQAVSRMVEAEKQREKSK